MFKSNYIACKMMLESMESEEVKKYGADLLLKAIIDMDEPENIHKEIITRV